MKNMKSRIFGFLYALALTAFTGYVLLDTFVIERVYTVVAASPGEMAAEAPEKTKTSAQPFAENQNAAESKASFITDLTYEDENISVVIREFREYDTTIYAADVRVSSPEYLKTALAKGAYGRNITQKTSEMAVENGAILAVNGDYYGAQERGYVLRNGQLLRNTAVEDKEDLVIFQDGSFSIINESEVSAEALLDAGAQQILSFGPALVADGGIAVSETEEVGRAKASNPRTAIGIIDELHYLFVVSDGRTDESAGLSLYQLAKLMEEMGAKTAYNLDGGGSSSLVFNGEVINNPASGRNHSKERSVSDIVYIGY